MVTITIDDLARELESGGGLSAQPNEAGWILLERRRRADRLRAQLDRADGPLVDDPATGIWRASSAASWPVRMRAAP